MSAIADHNDKIASERLRYAIGLIGNPDFAWFLRECVVKEQARLDEILHDRRKTAEERADALSEWTALKRVREWSEQQANDARKTLKHTGPPISIDLSDPKLSSAT